MESQRHRRVAQPIAVQGSLRFFALVSSASEEGLTCPNRDESIRRPVEEDFGCAACIAVSMGDSLAWEAGAGSLQSRWPTRGVPPGGTVGFISSFRGSWDSIVGNVGRSMMRARSERRPHEVICGSPARRAFPPAAPAPQPMSVSMGASVSLCRIRWAGRSASRTCPVMFTSMGFQCQNASTALFLLPSTFPILRITTYLAASHCILRDGKNGPAQPFGCGRRGLTVAPLQLSTPTEASASPAPIAPVCALVWAPAPRPSNITCESPKPNNQPPESNAASRPTWPYVEVPSSTLLRGAVLADCGCGNTHGCSKIGPLVEPLSCRAELLILGRRSSRERDTHQQAPNGGPSFPP
ncbi:hypothetical protein VFPBJ_07757 [Purpureocillium lilacinum]|uniref:Uncharacterized protein n=1 Tax=Purpureocillium lilacinum TaxID=33203 RepID=A0A179GHF3_PURLI|nr:hypothetical protein VFPBJ_07757 [Purpureocillium lilacinum]